MYIVKVRHLRECKTYMEMPGIEPGTFHMQSERSTAELHPQFKGKGVNGITGPNMNPPSVKL